MSDSLRDRITSEVRSFLKCVPDIEYRRFPQIIRRRVKYKTVLQMLEQHLNLSKDELTAEKDTIKSIIKVISVLTGMRA